jgi:hypothetical protein
MDAVKDLECTRWPADGPGHVWENGVTKAHQPDRKGHEFFHELERVEHALKHPGSATDVTPVVNTIPPRAAAKWR